MITKSTRQLQDTAEDLTEAAEILRGGGLVAFPTETVYGLGADATNDVAVARVFEAKARPQLNPLIVHSPDLDAAASVAVLEGDALRLAQAFWPGPLTLVLPMRIGSKISRLVTAGLDSVALRVPSHPLARRLMREVGRPLAAPSANRSGRISPTTAAHVIASLSGCIDAVLDGGPCSVGIESTIVGFPRGATLLRAGGIPAEVLEACLGVQLRHANKAGRPTAPGQIESHYAPNASLRLNAVSPREGEAYLGFGPGPESTLNLSANGDLVEAAAHLFGHLHALDALGVKRIAVAPIPDVGLGLAINDRLSRAAAPRAHAG